MADDGKRYVYIDAEVLSPQTIPLGFDGKHDWPDLPDEEKAKRGWLLYDPPAFDDAWERVEISKGRGRSLTYKLVPDDVEDARQAAFRRLADRANAAEAAPIVVNGQRYRLSDKAKSRIEAYAARAHADPAFSVQNWKIKAGTFVSLSNEELRAFGDALHAHVQARYDREAEIAGKLAAAKKTDKLRETFEAEIDKGWPGQRATVGA